MKDDQLAETLHKLRSSGKKLFLLTNSLYDYTDAVMRFLLDGQRQAYPSWRQYFDIVVMGRRKPAFFNKRHPFVQIDPITGAPLAIEVKHLGRDRVYMAGNVAQFEEMTHIRGEHVLYIGDHIYGDILRLRKQHMWRTAMVLQELEREINVLSRLENNMRDLDLLDRRRRNLESEIDYQVAAQEDPAAAGGARHAGAAAAAARGREEADQARARLAARSPPLMTEEVSASSRRSIARTTCTGARACARTTRTRGSASRSTTTPTSTPRGSPTCRTRRRCFPRATPADAARVVGAHRRTLSSRAPMIEYDAVWISIVTAARAARSLLRDSCRGWSSPR